MELKEFVTEVLTQIIDGVKDAQRDDLPTDDGVVNPALSVSYSEQQKQGRFISSSGQLVHSVKFDVGVTTTEGKGTKGGIGIFIGAVGLGSQGESEESQSSVSRIQFDVPISLPTNS